MVGKEMTGPGKRGGNKVKRQRRKWFCSSEVSEVNQAQKKKSKKQEKQGPR